MRELMVINADYNDLLNRISDFSKRFHKVYEEVNGKLNGKDEDGLATEQHRSD